MRACDEDSYIFRSQSYAGEALSPVESIFGGTEPTWTLDTGWLGVAVAGQALLLGMTLVRLVGREAR